MEYEKKVNQSILTIKPYTPGKSTQEVLRSQAAADVIKLASNENPLGMCPAAIEAVKKAVASAYQYPEVACPDLTEEIARRLRLAQGCVIPCSGADGVIYALGMVFLERADEVIIPDITFPLYETITKIMGAKVIRSRMKDYSIDLEDVLQKINRRTKMIWVCNPNNPTGTLIGRDTFADFVVTVPEDVLVVHDEVYFDFVDPNLFPNTLELIREGKKNLFLIRSFSKVYGLAGMRVGYGVGSDSLVKLLYRVRPPFDVSVLAQAAALGALKDAEFYRRTIEVTLSGKEYLYRNLKRLGLSFVPSHTNFVLIDTGMDDTVVCKRLLQEGLIARPAGNYRLPGHIRVTVGLPQQNQRFIEALSEIVSREKKS
jgi:histidinol-phosphate aminotransferase